MNFTKMHGAGNDYIYVDTFREEINNPEDLAVEISNRNTGIGGDGLILIMPSKIANVKMRMFNLDGSEAEMCGNGIRCLAKYAVDKKIVEGPDIKVETGRGILNLTTFKNEKGLVDKVKVNMGSPIFDISKIPANLKTDQEPVVDHQIEIDGNMFLITTLSMGNPHCVIFVDSVDNYPVHAHGKMIENSKYFPEKTNVEFVEIIKKNEVKIRTWERGSGETLACGTGATAVSVALKLKFNMEGPVLAHLLGGDLELKWETDGDVTMIGPAVEVFSGKYNPQ